MTYEQIVTTVVVGAVFAVLTMAALIGFIDSHKLNKETSKLDEPKPKEVEDDDDDD